MKATLTKAAVVTACLAAIAGARPTADPDQLVTPWSAFRSYGPSSNRYIRHRYFLGEVTPINSELDRLDSTFRLVKGLAGRVDGRPTVSFESKNFPGFYLRHQNFRIKLQKNDGSELFRKDASFKVRSPLVLSDESDLHSFEAVNYPGYFIRQRADTPAEEAARVFHLYLEKKPAKQVDAENPNSAESRWRRDCTFKRVNRPDPPSALP